MSLKSLSATSKVGELEVESLFVRQGASNLTSWQPRLKFIGSRTYKLTTARSVPSWTHKLLVLTLLFVSVGCEDKDTLYKAYEDIENGQWFVEKKFDFRFEVSDTTQSYNLYYLVRNAQQYSYYNLYLDRVMRGPEGKIIFSRLDEMYLSDEVTGKPRGSGLGDLYDHKFVFQRNYHFPKPGKYSITIAQSMRQNPLPFVLGVGLSIEKSPTDTR